MDVVRLNRANKTELGEDTPTALAGLPDSAFAAGTLRGTVFRFTLNHEQLERQRLGTLRSKVTVLHSQALGLAVGCEQGQVATWDGQRMNEDRLNLDTSVKAVYLTPGQNVSAFTANGECHRSNADPHHNQEQPPMWAAAFVDETSLVYCTTHPTFWRPPYFFQPAMHHRGVVGVVAVGSANTGRNEMVFGGHEGRLWHHSWANDFNAEQIRPLTDARDQGLKDNILALLLMRNDTLLIAADSQKLAVWHRRSCDATFQYSTLKRVARKFDVITGLAAVDAERIAVSFVGGTIRVYRIRS